MLLPPLATPASWNARACSGLAHAKPMVPPLACVAGSPPQKRCSSLPESAGQKLVAASQRPPRDPSHAAFLPHPRFRAAYSAAIYAARAAMSSSVIAFIRSDMPGLLPRAPVRKSSIVLSR